MSNVTIPDLPPGAVPTAASQFESVEGVASVRYTAAQIVGAGSSGVFLTKANNLSDVPDKAAARTNLGLGNVENKSSATIRSEITSLNVTGALGYTPLNPASNLSDVASVATARANLGITASGADAAYVWRTNNLSDLTNITTARTNLGLGTAAVKNTGTSGNTVPLLDGVNTFSGATNVFNGSVGIGTANPLFSLHVEKNQNDNTRVFIRNSTVGTGASALLQMNNDVSGSSIQVNSSGYAANGPFRADGCTFYTNGFGGITIASRPAVPIYFYTNDVERMQIDAAGNVKIAVGDLQLSDIQGDANANGAISSYHAANPAYGGLVFKTRAANTLVEHMRMDDAGNVLVGNTAQLYSERLQVSKGSAAEFTAVFTNTNTTPAGAIPLASTFPNASPNDSNTVFVYCSDSTAVRKKDLSNGGLANYSANNVNLSDANVKDQITPYSKTELAALEQSFTDVIWGKFKYRDQTHTDWNHGPTAQGVARAFEKTAPELVDESDLGAKPESGVKHKVIYETDLAHIAHALLANVLKSHTAALTRIADLEARLAAVGA